MALLEAFRGAGGTAPADVLAPLMEEHGRGERVSLAQLVYSGQVFGFEWRDSLWIPMFQFGADDLQLKPGPQQTRAELPSLWPGWTLAAWFAAPNDLLGQRRPVDLLDSSPDAVRRAARSTVSAEAVARPPPQRERELAEHA